MKPVRPLSPTAADIVMAIVLTIVLIQVICWVAALLGVDLTG